MVTSRRLEALDYELLLSSLQKDKYHRDTTTMFFVEPKTICNVYEDTSGPILFLRGKAEGTTLRLDIQFVSNDDHRRNLKAMVIGFPLLVENARQSGFEKVYFESETPALVAFSQKRLGFVATGRILERVI